MHTGTRMILQAYKLINTQLATCTYTIIIILGCYLAVIIIIISYTFSLYLHM